MWGRWPGSFRTEPFLGVGNLPSTSIPVKAIRRARASHQSTPSPSSRSRASSRSARATASSRNRVSSSARRVSDLGHRVARVVLNGVPEEVAGDENVGDVLEQTLQPFLDRDDPLELKGTVGHRLAVARGVQRVVRVQVQRRRRRGPVGIGSGGAHERAPERRAGSGVHFIHATKGLPGRDKPSTVREGPRRTDRVVIRVVGGPSSSTYGDRIASRVRSRGWRSSLSDSSGTSGSP